MTAVSMNVIKIKPGEMEAFREFLLSTMDRASEVPGLISGGWVETGESELTTIVVYKDREAVESASAFVQGIFADMASMVAAPPQRKVLDGEWFTL